MSLRESWEQFKEEIGYRGVKIEQINRTESIKASTNGTTYDRYDEKYGLHSKPKDTE
ncbi:hypothetical protein BvCmsB5655_03389 [Escherichia coli]|uniref:hypothetical protein n=1 Tax=Escherichia coli TaxID=562 RepID=UPI0010B6C358|nr:hypothetical protein [Escherichia coli]MED6573133.1 hypothetical protein [Escherichia coli O157]WAE77308.1 hypothetical protein vBEcoMphAPEC6_02255 [Escherichia phage ph0011]VVY16692.1 Uncharacterised protein [Escherichia coli]GCJ80348.1 hypothetical protein BvCmsB5655_03389 [Escherichia coli]HDS0644809.1 hypothetical protein [Escherichia coli]